MSKRKLHTVSWSFMFKVDKNRKEPSLSEYRDWMWNYLHKWDKEYPEAFCEWAFTEEYPDGEEGDAWYDWHGFKSRETLKRAVREIFKEFPENTKVEVYKDKEIGDFANQTLREIIRR